MTLQASEESPVYTDPRATVAWSRDPEIEVSLPPCFHQLQSLLLSFVKCFNIHRVWCVLTFNFVTFRSDPRACRPTFRGNRSLEKALGKNSSSSSLQAMLSYSRTKNSSHHEQVW